MTSCPLPRHIFFQGFTILPEKSVCNHPSADFSIFFLYLWWQILCTNLNRARDSQIVTKYHFSIIRACPEKTDYIWASELSKANDSSQYSWPLFTIEGPENNRRNSLHLATLDGKWISCPWFPLFGPSDSKSNFHHKLSGSWDFELHHQLSWFSNFV